MPGERCWYVKNHAALMGLRDVRLWMLTILAGSVDLIFIGPNDLALLGYASAKCTEPKFEEAVDRIVSTAKKHGKKVGILIKDGQSAKDAKDKFDFMALGADVRGLQAWYEKELSLARS